MLMKTCLLHLAISPLEDVANLAICSKIFVHFATNHYQFIFIHKTAASAVCLMSHDCGSTHVNASDSSTMYTY